jgi:hypothetical protein
MQILKSLGIAFITGVLLVSIREIFGLGAEEYFLLSGRLKFFENLAWGAGSVLLGWFYVFSFKALKMID